MKLPKSIKPYFEVDNLVDGSKISPANKKILQFVLIFLIFFTAFNYVSNGIFGYFISNSFDFHLVYDAARKINDGQASHIYDEFYAYTPGKVMMYMYPAAVAAIYTPLALFDEASAKIIFKLLTQLCFIFSFFLLLKSLGELKKIEKLLCYFLYFNFYPVFFSFQAGQSEALLLVFLLLFFYFFQKRWDIPSAFFLALVIYFKIFPIFFLLYFLWKREYRYSITLVAMLALLGWVSLLFVDFQTQKEFFLRIFKFREIDSFYEWQCITGFFSRIMTVGQYTQGWIDSKAAADFFTYLSSIIVVFFAGKATRKRLARADDRYKYEFSLLIISMLLLSRITDTHHFALLLIPFCYLSVYSFRKEKPVMLLFACYAFFATYIPLVAMKFIDWNFTYSLFIRGPLILVLSVPFYVLAAFWFLNLKTLIKYES